MIGCGRGGIFKWRLCNRVLSERQQPGSHERQKCEMHNSGNYVDTDEMSICFFRIRHADPKKGMRSNETLLRNTRA
jgi:hypothetical protein